MLAAAIVLAMVLYLIDKNQKWGPFWKISKWILQFALWCAAWAVLDMYVHDTFSRWGIIAFLVGMTALWNHAGKPAKDKT